jgi:hypothetical protein
METRPDPESTPITDPQAQARALERHQSLAVGLLALPNLFLRSAFTLFLLYGILTLVLITLVQFDVLLIVAQRRSNFWYLISGSSRCAARTYVE